MPTTFANTIDGNPLYAARAVADAAGNDIQTTYATKSEIVNADWDAVSGAPGYIENKPVIPEGVPAYTAAEEGKVLGVVEVSGSPALDWVQGGGSSDVFLATYGTTTFTEIQTAHNAGKAVFLYKAQAGSTSGYLIPMSLIFDNGGSGSSNRAEFEESMSSSSGGYIATCRAYSVAKSNNAWSSYYKYSVAQPSAADRGKVLQCNGADKAIWASISQVPASTSSDENKVLTVNSSGSPEWATPSAGGSVTDVEVNGTSVVNASGVAEVTVPAQVQPDWDATSGLGEILHKPTIPSVDQTYDATSTNAQSGVAVASAIASAGLFEALYGTTTYAEIVSAIAAKKVVYCRIEPYDYTTSRMAILTYIGSGTVEFQYYRSANPASAGDPNDIVYIYTVTSSGWSTTSRNVQKSADWNAASGPTSILNKPTIPAAQVNADWDATSGIAEILNKPTIPAAQVNSDWNASSGVAQILNKPTILPYKPVVAGTGVRIVDDTANNRIVVEADETVLWESQDNAGHQTATLSESRANFERIKILFSTSSSSKPYGMWYEIPSDTTDFNVMRGKGGSNVWMTWIRLTFSTNTSLTVASAKSFNFGAQSATSWVNPSVSVDMSEDINSIWKVIGVNRIASN